MALLHACSFLKGSFHVCVCKEDDSDNGFLSPHTTHPTSLITLLQIIAIFPSLPLMVKCHHKASSCNFPSSFIAFFVIYQREKNLGELQTWNQVHCLFRNLLGLQTSMLFIHHPKIFSFYCILAITNATNTFLMIDSKLLQNIEF